MSFSLHYKLHCTGCGMPILLPPQMLERAFPGLTLQSTGKEHLAALCTHCNQVRSYDLERKSPNRSEGPVVSLSTYSGWVFALPLECEEATCEAHLPLFAAWNPTISAEDWKRYLDSRIWNEMKCSNGHPVPKPTFRLAI
jgi:hypothetical protein